MSRLDTVAALTREGRSAREIAAILGCSARTVVRYRARLGISQPLAGDPLTPAERARIEELLDDGCSYSEVARTVGRSATTVIRQFPGRGWPQGGGQLTRGWVS